MPATPDHPSDRDLNLLRILCCVAWADGTFALEEQDLLDRLIARYGLGAEDPGSTAVAAAVLAATPEPLEALDHLVPRLSSPEDRLLAVKLAYMLIRLGGRGEGETGINAREKTAYRRLVEAIGLPGEEVVEAEWAAEQERSGQSGLLALLRSRFAWLAG